MFPETKPPRAKPQKLMHVTDAGDHGCVYEPGNTLVVFCECAHCGYKSGWFEAKNVSTSKRGYPCPKCNPDHHTNIDSMETSHETE